MANSAFVKRSNDRLRMIASTYESRSLKAGWSILERIVTLTKAAFRAVTNGQNSKWLQIISVTEITFLSESARSNVFSRTLWRKKSNKKNSKNLQNI